ncbi:ADP-ribosylation factor-binding protein GGA1 [Anastrepha obliqua]|uniref:ADP-ribosylation factor-binding protein GGA1 n=1 Tax=Anastrepha obliqua TaxID=95512 RepID=UPI0024092E6E|nr:ADP-ribosylation factor-binding protein GGA1 [Anastrepha obliqua]
MTTDENIMEEMLERATNPSRGTVDELSWQMFCMVVRSNPKLVDRAQEMIMQKIRSNNIAESTRSIDLLEECMTTCGPEFQDEASKFRFLNQLIRLVSKKHQGPDTPAPIKKRIMECLLLWTTEFPQRTKIRDVYEMLCKEGGVDHGTTSAIEAKRASVLGIDEEVLAKLIKSNDPENFKRANLLIQNRVKQDARRMDLLIEHKNILQEVTTTVSVLDQMLNIYESEGKKSDAESDTMCLMRELYQACKKHKSIMERLPALMGNLDETLIAETVEKNDSLQAVIKRYKNLVGSPTKKPTTNDISEPSPKSAAVEPIRSSSADLLSDLLGNESNITPTTESANAASSIDEVELLGATANLPTSKVDGTSLSPLEELQSLFDAGAVGNTGAPITAKNMTDVYSLNILEPINVFATSTAATSTVWSNAMGKEENSTEKGAYRKLPAIDKLSEDLLKASLQDVERAYSFKKDSEKLTLNKLAKEKIVSTPPFASPSKTEPKMSEHKVHQEMDDENMLNESSHKNAYDLEVSTKSDDTGKSHKIACDLEVSTKSEDTDAVVENEQVVEENPPIRHLADIEIDLDEVDPAPGDPLLLGNDDIKLMLNFTKNRPSKQVSVIVISAMNKSKLPVHDFQFEASVRKPCKLRLLQPTAITMLPCKPFRPASPINQVMLLLNPTGQPIDVTCIFGYKLGDDPDPIKESNVAKDIPYVE